MSGFTSDTAATARKNQLDKKKQVQAARNEQLNEARHQQGMYGCDATTLREIFKVQENPRQNYEQPTKANLNPSKDRVKCRFKCNRGHQMLNAALTEGKKCKRGHQMLKAALAKAKK
eukprot:218552_1